MNKTDLIDAVGSATKSKAEAARVVDATTNAIKAELSKGGSVQLIGFGTFSVKQRQARSGRNPRTGETIQIKAAKAVSFKAGKGLKDAVN